LGWSWPVAALAMEIEPGLGSGPSLLKQPAFEGCRVRGLATFGCFAEFRRWVIGIGLVFLSRGVGGVGECVLMV